MPCGGKDDPAEERQFQMIVGLVPERESGHQDCAAESRMNEVSCE